MSRPDPLVHAWDGDDQPTLCCGKTPAELPMDALGSYRAELVTCPGRPPAEADLRYRIADELDQHAPSIGPRDPEQPDVWFSWCECGWDGGRYSESYDHRYRLHVADAVLALPTLQQLIEQAAELADLRARIARVRSMRAVATDDKVTVAALDWALDGET